MILKEFDVKARNINIYNMLTFVWIITIFSFSLQPAEVSGEVSSGFARKLIELFFPSFIDEFEALPEAYVSFLHHLFRKCAHFTEYFVLGILVYLSEHRAGVSRKIFFGIVVCMLVAATDETLQLFVSGRAGRLFDVVLDTIGAATGCLIVRRFIKE